MASSLPFSMRDIVLFVATYEEHSFTRAAEREGATQSGVSQHIRKLEERFNTQLFLRQSPSLTPTPAADAFYRHAIELLQRYEVANRNLCSFKGDLSGEVKVGMMAMIARSALAPALIEFERQHPNVYVSVIESHSRLLGEKIVSGELDFAIVPSALEQEGVKRSFFLRAEEVALSSKKSGFPNLRTIDFSCQQSLKLVVPSRYNVRRAAIDRHLSMAGVRTARLLELDIVSTTLSMVANSDWLSILPRLAMPQPEEILGVSLHPLIRPVWLDMDMIEPARRPLSMEAMAFYRTLKAASEAINSDMYYGRHAKWPGLSDSAVP